MNPRVAKLPQYKGFPVPYFARIRMDGTPDFKITDEGKRQRCAIERRCWICGGLLGHYTAFLGGPVSVANRLFVDGPMHKDCAVDALALCPFMLGKTDYASNESFQPERHAEPIEFTRERPDQQKPPEKIGLLISRGFGIYQRRYLDGFVWFFQPFSPDAEPVLWQERSPNRQGDPYADTQHQ
jgi:hypothetical protein